MRNNTLETGKQLNEGQQRLRERYSPESNYNTVHNNVVLAAAERSWKHEKKKNKQTNGDNRPGQQPRREREIIFKMADFNGNTLTHYNTE